MGVAGSLLITLEDEPGSRTSMLYVPGKAPLPALACSTDESDTEAESALPPLAEVMD